MIDNDINRANNYFIYTVAEMKQRDPWSLWRLCPGTGNVTFSPDLHETVVIDKMGDFLSDVYNLQPEGSSTKVDVANGE